MKVVAYLHAAPPLRLVGGEAMTLRLMADSLARGHDAVVVVATFDQAVTWRGLPLLPAKSWRVAAHDADVIVTHPEIAGSARVRTGQATVHIVHNLSRATVRKVLRGPPPTALVANSQWTAAGLADSGAAVDAVLYPPAETPPDLGLPRRFVTAVNLSADKGGDVFYAVADAMPGVPFLGVAGGHGVQHVPAGVPGNVTLVGHGPLDLPMAVTRVLLAPSRSETYGMVPAEATLAGLPVVARDLPAHREVLGDAAHYPDGDDWTAAVKAAWGDDGSAARARARVLETRREATLDGWDGLLASLVV